MKAINFILSLIILLFNIKNAEIKRFNFDFSQKFKNISWDNPYTLNDSSQYARSFQKIQSKFSIQSNFTQNISAKITLSNQIRNYFVPNDREIDWNEIYFDAFYLHLKKIFSLPVELKIGRQNLVFGEGFSIMEGTPLDASRSQYFNAIRFDFKMKKQHHLTLFYADNPKQEKFLPVFHASDYPLIEQSTQALSGYYSANLKKTDFDFYYLYKKSNHNSQYPLKQRTHAFGFLIKKENFVSRLSFHLETVFEKIDQANQNKNALGGYFYLDYHDFIPIIKKVQIGSVFFSKDYDPLFGRWPQQWSESYPYAYYYESRIAYWSNLQAPFIKTNFRLFDQVLLEIGFLGLYAFESLSQKEYPGGNGTKRGNLLTVRIGFPIQQKLKVKMIYETFFPGDFYYPNAKPYQWMMFIIQYN